MTDKYAKGKSLRTFKVIDCGSYIYIANNNKYEGSLEKFLFDGKSPEKTKHQEWYKLDTVPKEILVEKPKEKINIRYELKKGYVPTELMPEIITNDMYHDEDGEYDDVIGLYNYKYDEKEAGFESIEFEVVTIYQRKDFEFIPNKYNASVDLLTLIEYPDVAYQDRPCKLSSEQVYNLIREHVKSHIDKTVAVIKSDYDFHFEVERQIQLADPYTVQVDTNNSSSDKRRKPKWVDRQIKTKGATILNLRRKPSDNTYGTGCVLAPEIIGDNYADLSKKVEVYLSGLMKEINKKYQECPHCHGWGVMEVEE